MSTPRARRIDPPHSHRAIGVIVSARRDELVELAESLIEEHGLDNFSLGSLAKAAGIRTPSLYKHFSSLAELEHAIISREFVRLAESLDEAANATASDTPHNRIAQFATAYRMHAHAHPQLYRLATERPLDRALLGPGSELAAMQALLQYFGESPTAHDRARAAWAAAHGLVSLELAGRFPPDADTTGAWEEFINAFTMP